MQCDAGAAAAPAAAEPEAAREHDGGGAAAAKQDQQQRDDATPASEAPAPGAAVEHVDGIRRRVMVFLLNAERQWDDKGTGMLRCSCKPHLDIHVDDEESGEVLLAHVVKPQLDYVKQGDSIVTWFDPDLDNDVAVSFQEAQGCEVVWDLIQKAKTGVIGGGEHMVSPEEVPMRIDMPRLVLPSPQLGNLESICDMIMKANSSQRDELAQQLVEGSWFSQLCDVFDQAVDLEADDQLREIFSITKAMFLINSLSVIEMLMSSQYVHKVIAFLEYDPDLPSDADFHRHRTWLEQSRFKDVVPIKKPSLLEKIKQNYLIMYVRDVALLRHLDEATSGSLSSMFFFNTVNVLTPLSDDSEFLTRLISALEEHSEPLYFSGRTVCSPDAFTERRRDLFMFLQELCNLAKNLQLRSKFFAKLANAGLFNIIEKALISCDAGRERWLLDVLARVMNTLVQHDAQLLRTHMIFQSREPRLLKAIVNIVVAEDAHVDRGLSHEMAEILRLLLDPETLQFTSQNMFVENVFLPHVQRLIDAATDPKMPGHGRYNSTELLCFLFRDHMFAMKPVARQHRLLSRCIPALLAPTESMELKLAGVRLLRSCLPAKEDFFANLVVQQRVLDPVVEVFTRNGSRYNLLNSAVIELFEHVRSVNLRPMVADLVERHFKAFEHIKYVDVFAGLRIRHAQNIDSGPGTSGTGSPERIHVQQQHRVAEDTAEDLYFSNTEDDDGDVSKDSTPAGPAPDTDFLDRAAFAVQQRDENFLSIVSSRRGQSRSQCNTGGGRSARMKLKVGKAKKSKIKSRPIVVKLVEYDDDDDEQMEHKNSTPDASPQKRIRTQ